MTSARDRFRKAHAVSPATMDRVRELTHEFKRSHPRPRPAAAEFREKYSRIFSRDTLEGADPDALHLFANSSHMANPGNMSVFNRTWNELGAEEAAKHVVHSIDYLLYGPTHTSLEYRLTTLIEDRSSSMKGFKEALLTKVLCVAYPERFLPILMYTGQAGKVEIADAVYSVRLPRPDSRSRLGSLIVWSNDLLVDMLAPDFDDLTVAAAFLWWAKDRGPAGPLGVNTNITNMVDRDV